MHHRMRIDTVSVIRCLFTRRTSTSELAGRALSHNIAAVTALSIFLDYRAVYVLLYVVQACYLAQPRFPIAPYAGAV